MAAAHLDAKAGRCPSERAAKCVLGRLGDCTTANHAEYNDNFVVLSRASPEIDFIVSTETESGVYRRICDERIADPVTMVINPFLWTVSNVP